jgi:transcriptional regulator with XRE-family HTH domain
MPRPERDIRERFGQNLSRRMKFLKHDNNTLAEQLGVSRTEVWRYTAGLVMPSWDRYAELCRTLRVDPSYLIKDSKGV